jgi:alpha-glucosidase (family GH31 glycosyl hydrolase)
MAQGLIGHPFNCPDMIGGGDVESFRDATPLDQELFVRFAQCSALFPMMQFSLAPWRVLDDLHLSAVLAAVNTRQALMPDLSRLFEHAARTGEPILRSLAYHFPGYEAVHDQFLLGEEILCAPILERGATTRLVVLPPGRWRDNDGSVTEGPAEIALSVRRESLPFWRMIRD